jgi:hypothetical protein
MNCHGNHNNNENGQKHSPLKHMLHMVICCGLPIAIIFLLPYIAKFSPSVAGVLGIIAPFLCPIMMIGMMVIMVRANRKAESSCHKNEKLDEKAE